MKKILAVLVMALMVCSARAGFILTVENDAFTGSDNNYTHGTELAYSYLDDGIPVKEGIRSWFYTPNDISIAEPQPNDRPWCGVSVVFYERTESVETSDLTWGLEAGVQGPSAGAEWQQTEWHRLIHNDLPVGWDNQEDDWPVLTVYGELANCFARYGREGSWEANAKLLLGGAFGTQTARAGFGSRIEAGWNVPSVPPGGITPKVKKSSGFASVFMEGRENAVAYNTTINNTFRTDQSDLTLNPVVGELRYGIRAGWKWLSAMYALCRRTEEFEGQEGQMDWGVVSLAFGSCF